MPLFLKSHPDLAASRGMLEGVGSQVGDHQGEPSFLAGDGARLQVQGQHDTGGLHGALQGVENGVHYTVQSHGTGGEGSLARLHAAQIQKSAHQGGHLVGLVHDDVQVLGPLVRGDVLP